MAVGYSLSREGKNSKNIYTGKFKGLGKRRKTEQNTKRRKITMIMMLLPVFMLMLMPMHDRDL